eukprot:359159-Chlamydomonas_euryale.AAC.12
MPMCMCMLLRVRAGGRVAAQLGSCCMVSLLPAETPSVGGGMLKPVESEAVTRLTARSVATVWCVGDPVSSKPVAVGRVWHDVHTGEMIRRMAVAMEFATPHAPRTPRPLRPVARASAASSTQPWPPRPPPAVQSEPRRIRE